MLSGGKPASRVALATTARSFYALVGAIAVGLAASLGLTFSYNVTIGIPVYLLIATALTRWTPVA